MITDKDKFATINENCTDQLAFFDFCYGKLCDILEQRKLYCYSNNISDYIFFDEITRSIKVHPDLIIALGGDPAYPPGWRKLYEKWKSL